MKTYDYYCSCFGLDLQMAAIILPPHFFVFGLAY